MCLQKEKGELVYRLLTNGKLQNPEGKRAARVKVERHLLFFGGGELSRRETRHCPETSRGFSPARRRTGSQYYATKSKRREELAANCARRVTNLRLRNTNANQF